MNYILIKIYTQIYIEAKYGAFYSINEVMVHRVSLVNFTRSYELKSSSYSVAPPKSVSLLFL